MASAVPETARFKRERFLILNGGVQNHFSVDVPYPHGTRGTLERNVGNRQGNGGTDHGQNIRGIVGIVAEHRGRHLNAVMVIRGKQRANGAVDQAAG